MRLLWMPQEGDRWHKWRRWKVCASDAPVILGVSPYKTADRLLREKTEGLFTPPTYAMRKGRRLESKIRDLVEQETGYVFQPACAECDPPNDWLAASLDGITFDQGLILECKYNKEEFHDQALEGKVPEHHVPQVQHQLFVTGAAFCVYASHNDGEMYATPELQLATVFVEPDAEYLAKLLEAEEKFWKELCQARMRVSA